jgi:hypothetical protein
MVNRNRKKIGHGIYHGQYQQYSSVITAKPGNASVGTAEKMNWFQLGYWIS